MREQGPFLQLYQERHIILKIIISPSKTQNLACQPKVNNKPLFNEKKSQQLRQVIKKLKKEELAILFKIKDKLLEETYKLYHDKAIMNQRYDPIGFYDGVVYEQLCLRNHNNKNRQYLEQKLVILSAMFGILEPGMSMWSYRLDFKTKPGGINLYEYWQKDILEYFNQESTIINLASTEFSTILKPIREKVINIHFLEADGRVLSYQAKKARGQMADAMVELEIEETEDLKKITIDDYVYNQEKSDDRNYYYQKGRK